MISRNLELACNYRKCKKPLLETAVVTICQHIFCLDHAPKYSNSSLSICPVCNIGLNGALNDFIQVELKPSDRFIALILAGQTPETIFEICQKAINFYQFQQLLTSQFLEYVAVKSIQKSKEMEKEFNAIFSQLKEENALSHHKKIALSKECEELRSKLVASEQRLIKLDKDLQALQLNKSKSDVPSKTESNLINKSFHQMNSKYFSYKRPLIENANKQEQESPDTVCQYGINTSCRFNGFTCLDDYPGVLMQKSLRRTNNKVDSITGYCINSPLNKNELKNYAPGLFSRRSH